MTQNIYVNAELSRELEELGVNQPTGLGVAYAMVNKEMAPNGERYVPYTIFDLLYPENARLIWPEGTTRVWKMATVEVLHMWQAGMDWRSYVAEAVELRKAEARD